MKDKKPGLGSLIAQLRTATNSFRRYSFLIFIVFISLLYAFVVFRINSLVSAEPSTDAIAGHVTAAKVPKIDKAVVEQLESLQDNSVSVQALFDQARSNPFQ